MIGSNSNSSGRGRTETIFRIKSLRQWRASGFSAINPAATVDVEIAFAYGDTLDELVEGKFDLVIDAVDSVNRKMEILAVEAVLEKWIASIPTNRAGF